MSRSEASRLTDIIEAIELIRLYDGEIRNGVSDALSQDAIAYRLMVIGEAAKDLTPELKAKEPDIEWAGMAGMRDILTHHYHRIDQGILDDVVANRLDQLAEACARLLRELH